MTIAADDAKEMEEIAAAKTHARAHRPDNDKSRIYERMRTMSKSVEIPMPADCPDLCRIVLSGSDFPDRDKYLQKLLQVCESPCSGDYDAQSKRIYFVGSSRRESFLRTKVYEQMQSATMEYVDNDADVSNTNVSRTEDKFYWHIDPENAAWYPSLNSIEKITIVLAKSAGCLSDFFAFFRKESMLISFWSWSQVAHYGSFVAFDVSSKHRCKIEELGRSYEAEMGTTGQIPLITFNFDDCLRTETESGFDWGQGDRSQVGKKLDDRCREFDAATNLIKYFWTKDLFVFRNYGYYCIRKTDR